MFPITIDCIQLIKSTSAGIIILLRLLGSFNWHEEHTFPIRRILSNRMHFDQNFILFEGWYWNVLDLHSLALFGMMMLEGRSVMMEKSYSTSCTTRAFIFCGIERLDIIMN